MVDNTNSRHLELYTVLGEYDNAGFPLSYCLLSTVAATEIGKRTKALTAWGTALREKYGIIPQIVHVDKDMAEIGSVARHGHKRRFSCVGGIYVRLSGHVFN